jgi:hypothetical protein
MLESLTSYVSAWTEPHWIMAGVAFNDIWVPIYVTANALKGVGADYGRYSSAAKSGAGLDPRLFWVLMEVPNLIGAFAVFHSAWQSEPHRDLLNNPGFWIAGLFTFHYVLRTCVYALLIRGGTRCPVSFLLLGGTFTVINGYAQVCYHLHYAKYPEGYFYSPQFVCGCAIFFLGLVTNQYSDSILRNLRKGPEDKKYYIPRGGLFEYVSGANFLAESIEWAGYGLASGTFVGWSFFWSTLINTGARAYNHHQDNNVKFKEEYPKHRKAFIPYVF